MHGLVIYVNYDRMLLVQWLFQTLITPPSQRSARLAYPMHDSLVAVAGAVGVGVISWYLKQIRKDRVVPIVSPTGWSIMRGRHLALPTRTLATTPASSARRLRRHSRQFSPPHDRANLCRGDFVTVPH